ncbi:ABC transporter substrate-binding protein [Metabacillus hrfriensis]|uniref:ABC transporter substrate-binding protein n=1 Tax=Metabacillus hrfriensis TaxID=3048891 RepID=A0ACD4RFI6_9BACI|nr:ABC transporter substrate-binding protein [Metabacillus sp. CT-WN-B3]WHZ59208.1 ABC transporter substrate-binding protein [Metabacillus sp. CT-WN-B3]
MTISKGMIAMKSRKVSGIVMILFMFCAVIGCTKPVSTEDADADSKVQLTIWYYNRSIDDELLARVQEQFPHVRLKTQKIDSATYKTKLQTTLIAKNGAPDIVAMNDWVSEFLPYHDEFVNLLDLEGEKIKDQYLDWKWNQALTPDKKHLIALPMDIGPTVLFYREDLFKEAGLPTDPADVSAHLSTWDDYIKAGEQMKVKTGVYMFDTINRVFTQLTSQRKDIFFNKSDQFIGDGPSIKEDWEYGVEIHKKGLSANLENGPEWSAGMNNGKVASFVGASWEKLILQDAAPDTAGKWRVARGPGGGGNNGGSFIGVLKSSNHPKEAYEVIKWLMNPENQLQSYLKMDLFPSTPSIYDQPEMIEEESFFGGQKTVEVFSEAAQDVPVAYYGPEHSTARAAFDEQLLVIARQNKDPGKAWKDALEKIKRELSH